MPGRIGRKVEFKWNSIAVPGVREKSAACNGAPINVSSDESDGWQYLLDEAGENAVTISISGVTKSTILKADWFAGTRTRDVTFTYPDGGVLAGSFFMASYSESEPYNEATTFESELQSSGEITYTPPAVPVNTVLPAVSGIAEEDEVLTALPGTWTGAPTSYTYQWQQDTAGNGSFVNISGATAATYTVVAGNVGNAIRVVVTGVNGAGSASANSGPTQIATGS